ncbi:Putative DNA binding protein [Bifidobacterium animalis subsp. animalis IM386]|uniref:DNA binding protein n=1 Tax=Bifidobacterium animalis subsp. animalis IM386 TaxID=1402194 RepID=A0AAV2W0M9_9BIFI|nr:Putative DNA binding protein [Bifidobacterium animalis subsp. animalis IM386]
MQRVPTIPIHHSVLKSDFTTHHSVSKSAFGTRHSVSHIVREGLCGLGKRRCRDCGYACVGIGAAHRGEKALRGTHSETQQLERLNILDKNGHVRLAGLLIAGVYPQQFFPRLYVDVAVHPGISKSQDDEVRFLDRVQCHGRLQEMVDDAVKAVLRNLRTYSLTRGTEGAMYRRFQLWYYARQSPMPWYTGNTTHCFATTR